MIHFSFQSSRAVKAVTAMFFVFGLCIGTWAPHIPIAKERLSITPGWFGLALLCMGLGAVISMPVAGVLVNKYGSARLVTIFGISVAVFLPIPVMSSYFVTFSISLLLLGASLGALDVVMNAHGVAVERKLGKPVMSTFHGVYSIAALIGAAFGALLIGHLTELTRVLLTSATCLVITISVLPMLLPADADRGMSGTPFELPTRATFGLGLLCLFALMIEGSVLDWAGIHMYENLEANNNLTSLNFATFSGGMAFSRLLGDKMRLRFSSAQLVHWCGISTALFLAIAILVQFPLISLIAFALVGLTLGPLAPILYAGGGQAEPEHPGRGIAAVTTLGYLGALIGPPLVGFLAEITGLRIALCVMVLFALAIGLSGSIAKIVDTRSSST